MNPSEVGSVVFYVDFNKIKLYVNKITSEIIRQKFIENIDCYSNDKNELSLKSIISLHNELMVAKENSFDEEAEEGGNISIEYIDKIIQYLDEFANNKFSEGEQQINEEVIKPTSKEAIEVDETNNPDKPISNSVIKSKFSTIKPNENDSNLNTISQVDSSQIINEIIDLNSEFKFVIENLLSETLISHQKTIESKIANIFSKMEVDKTDILVNIQKSQKMVDEKITLSSTVFNKSANELLESFNSGKSETHKLIELTTKEEIKKGFSEGKIIAEIDESDKKALKGVKISVILSSLSFLGLIILFYMSTQWYGDSVKYKNIIKVEQSLQPYEQSVFTSIITTGYANTKDNPRANPNLQQNQ